MSVGLECEEACGRGVGVEQGREAGHGELGPGARGWGEGCARPPPASSAWRLEEGVMLKAQGQREGRADEAPSAGPGTRRVARPKLSSPCLGRTVVDDPQDLFKDYREKELEKKRNLYRSALLPRPTLLPTPPRPRGAVDHPPHYQRLLSLLHGRWGNWKDGLILNVVGATISDLPADERFLEDKRIDFEASLAKG